MIFSKGSNSHLPQSLRITVYTLPQSLISKSWQLFFYDAHFLYLGHDCPTHRVLLFSSNWSQDLRFLVLRAIAAVNSCPKVTHSQSLFPAQKPSASAPTGFSFYLKTWLPRGGQGHSLDPHVHSLVPLLPDSNLLFKYTLVSPAPLLTHN